MLVIAVHGGEVWSRVTCRDREGGLVQSGASSWCERYMLKEARDAFCVVLDQETGVGILRTSSESRSQ